MRCIPDLIVREDEVWGCKQLRVLMLSTADSPVMMFTQWRMMGPFATCRKQPLSRQQSTQLGNALDRPMVAAR